MAYVYQPFPKMLYRDGQQCVVAGAGQELVALADGWGHTPDHVSGADEPSDPVAPLLPVVPARVKKSHHKQGARTQRPYVRRVRPVAPEVEVPDVFAQDQ